MVVLLPAENPSAVLLTPVVFFDNAVAPTAVLSEMLPAPLPTVIPLIFKSFVK